jgi:hypothetical protein
MIVHILETLEFKIPVSDDIHEEYLESLKELNELYEFSYTNGSNTDNILFTIPSQKLKFDEYGMNGFLWRLSYFFKLHLEYLLMGGDGCEPNFTLSLEYYE